MEILVPLSLLYMLLGIVSVGVSVECMDITSDTSERLALVLGSFFFWFFILPLRILELR